ncbi:hypothetical protein HWC16_gp009 [Salmonella phage Sepoy]|uniref:Uncharacterized protein n=1 Tax=Salmonella phage Sepoy TaxID=2565517 RepID=A0A4P8NDT7_9CAUD|nr:hypothetical protein HWC16_gp009 [Salmonella phage Sepoy]QCQ65503.1 hypothetical protein Sepoy_009 [Salmonella phage Sepoy]
MVFFTFLYKNKVAPFSGIPYYLSRRTARRKRKARLQRRGSLPPCSLKTREHLKAYRR